VLTEWARGPAGLACLPQPLAAECGAEEEVWRALMLGVRGHGDGLGRFRGGVLVELSDVFPGSLAAVLAVDALGPEKVHGVALGAEGEAQIEAFAGRLGIGFETWPLEEASGALRDALRPALGDALEPTMAARWGSGVARGLYARLKGAALRAIAEQRGMMLISAHDATHVALGDAVTDVDLAPFKDLPHRQLAALAQWRNAERPAGARGPVGPLMDPEQLALVSAQTELDAILEGLFDRGLSVAELVAAGHEPGEVAQIRRCLARGEAARRMAPPGIRLRAPPLGRDPRYPLANTFMDPDT
jgi:NAD+ synthase